MNMLAGWVHALVGVLRGAIVILPPSRQSTAKAGVRRIAASVCLPAALASVVVGFVPGQSMAAAPTDLRSRIEWASRSPIITLKLVHGMTVSGQFYGFLGDWSDSLDSALRYESWRKTRAESVPRHGESMFVVLAAGDTLHGTFSGVGPTFLALAGGGRGLANVVAFDSIKEARPDSSGSAEPWTDLSQRLHDAPPLTGIGLMQGTTLVVVARESIVSVEGDRNAASDGTRAMLIVLGIGLAVAMVVICAQEAKNQAQSSANNASNSLSTCSSPGSSNAGLDRMFGASTVSRGLEPLPEGETRRP